MPSSISNRKLRTVALAMLALIISLPLAAENRVGGHVGVVFPLASYSDGDTTTIADDFSVGFPTGVSVIISEKLIFDMEVVPVIHEGASDVDLTIHPGFVRPMGSGYAVGIRAAFDVGHPSYGFTPLINRAFKRSGGGAYFAELVLPVRFQRDDAGDTQASIGVGVHLGFGF